MTKQSSLSDEEWSIAPNGLKKLLEFALSRPADQIDSEYDNLFPGFYWGGSTLKLFGFESWDSGRYPKAPPEFFPFARLGQDGIYYGYVIHAPELNISNPPVGIFDPIPNEGVKLLGNDFEDALDKLLSEALGFYSTDEELQIINAIASLLNVQPNLDKHNPRYMEYDDPIIPTIPPGWQFEHSSDGIGVLAPCKAFIDRSPTCETWSFDIYQGKGYPIIQNVEAALELTEECFERNAPASALFILRELYWRTSDERLFIESKELWKNAYSQLERPLLSNVVEQEARFRQQWLEESYKTSSEYEVSGTELIGIVFEPDDEQF